MSGLAGLIVSLNSASASAMAGLRSLPSVVGTINLRADLAGDIDPSDIRRRCRCRVLYSLYSCSRAGATKQPDRLRHRRLLDAARRFDFIELEAEHDIVPQLLSAIEPSRRVISWRGSGTDAASLAQRFVSLVRTPAALYLLAPRASRFVDTIAPLLFLSALNRRDVIAYDAGPAGFWTRLIAPRLGAPLVFADIEDELAGLDIRSIAALIDDYGLPALPPVTTLYGIVGRAVQHSLSPRLHNARYRADGRAAIFVPFPTLDVAEMGDGMAAVQELAKLGLSLRGLTVTAPFKEAALALAHSRSAPAVNAGSANLLVRQNSSWRAETTDPQGVLDALAVRGLSVAGETVAVIGCGGAGRAIAVALREAGARVTLINRTAHVGRSTARGLGLRFVPLARLRPADYAVIVNATPVGSDGVSTLVDPQALNETAVVVDLSYAGSVTPLVAGARARGHTVVDGLEVLDHQVRHQYARMAEVDDVLSPPLRFNGGGGFQAARQAGIFDAQTITTPG
jgi:3-dehydroquinate dehydratase/shikimate dehydrogenase